MDSKQETKVSPSEGVHFPSGAIKNASLALGPLDRALCNLADLGKSCTDLQKVFQVSLEALRTAFLYLRWASL